MKKVKKIITAVLSVTLAATMVGCTPTIGAGTSTAMTIDKYDVPAGLFIYYTMQGYSEASGILEDQRGSAPELKDVKNATIDSVDSTDWIQNKATDYCLDYVTIIKEFDDMGGELSQEDIDSAESMASYYYAQDKSRLDDNGVSLDTMEKMAQMTYKERAVFKHYYGYDGSEGCTEEELKDYFDDNFARIKYVSISLTDSEGNALTEDEQRERRKMAEKYAEQVNKKTDVLDKMHELRLQRLLQLKLKLQLLQTLTQTKDFSRKSQRLLLTIHRANQTAIQQQHLLKKLIQTRIQDFSAISCSMNSKWARLKCMITTMKLYMSY